VRCQLGQLDFGGQLVPDAEHLPNSTRHFAGGRDPPEPKWAGSALSATR